MAANPATKPHDQLWNLLEAADLVRASRACHTTFKAVDSLLERGVESIYTIQEHWGPTGQTFVYNARPEVGPYKLVFNDPMPTAG